jgi:hypothetical protein
MPAMMSSPSGQNPWSSGPKGNMNLLSRYSVSYLNVHLKSSDSKMLRVGAKV